MPESPDKFIDAIINGKCNALGLAIDYFEGIPDNLETFRIIYSQETNYYEILYDNIQNSLPLRDDIIKVVTLLVKYMTNNDYIEVIYWLLKSVIPFMFAKDRSLPHCDMDFYNYRFIIQEIFLYILAILLKYRKFKSLDYILSNSYYYEGCKEACLCTYVCFYQEMHEFSCGEKKDEKIEYFSKGKLLFKRRRDDIGFSYLMQADIIAFFRSIKKDAIPWGPNTLDRKFLFQIIPLEVFEETASAGKFENVSLLLGVNSKEELEEKIKSAIEILRNNKVNFTETELKTLLAYDQL